VFGAGKPSLARGRGWFPRLRRTRVAGSAGRGSVAFRRPRNGTRLCPVRLRDILTGSVEQRAPGRNRAAVGKVGTARALVAGDSCIRLPFGG
jgi:hypothetical protein